MYSVDSVYSENSVYSAKSPLLFSAKTSVPPKPISKISEHFFHSPSALKELATQGDQFIGDTSANTNTIPPVPLFLLFFFFTLQMHLPLSNSWSFSTPSLPYPLHMSLSVSQWDLQKLLYIFGHGLFFTTQVSTKMCNFQCIFFATQNSSLSSPYSFYKASSISMDTKVTLRIQQQPSSNIEGDRCWFCYVQILRLIFKYSLTHCSPSTLLDLPLDPPTIQVTRNRPWDPPSPTTLASISSQTLFGFSMDWYKITPILEFFTFILTTPFSKQGHRCFEGCVLFLKVG